VDDDAGAESRAGFVAELCEGAPVAGVERGAGLDFDRGDGAGAAFERLGAGGEQMGEEACVYECAVEVVAKPALAPAPLVVSRLRTRAGWSCSATTVVSVLFPTWRAPMTNTTRVSFVKPIDQPLPAFAPRLFSHARID
jgi:hypothetical protein